jgi:hypothetical protein
VLPRICRWKALQTIFLGGLVMVLTPPDFCPVPPLEREIERWLPPADELRGVPLCCFAT